MTQNEMEAEIKGLREQILQLQQQQENQKTHWYRWGQICSFIALGSVIVGFHDMIVIGGPPQLLIGITGLCGFFSWAFGSAGRPPAHLSFWSQLKWGWSGMLETRTSSNVR
jgi:hypothetical protein